MKILFIGIISFLIGFNLGILAFVINVTENTKNWLSTVCSCKLQ